MQLYRQRQLALRSGRLYTRLPSNSFAAQWQHVVGQPTYQDWQHLLGREARAVAAGQGSNRLEVILGDSLGMWLPNETLPRDRLWLNQAISGETTQGILQRLTAFADTQPTVIHLMAGINDLKQGASANDTAYNLRVIVRRLQQQHPQAQIVLYSVLPTRRVDISNDQVRSLNTRLARVAAQEGTEYRDLHRQFLDEWGHMRADLTTDGLHLNPAGYRLWQRSILARARS